MNRADVKIEGKRVTLKLRAQNMETAFDAIRLAQDAPQGYRLSHTTIERKETGVFRVLRLTYIGTKDAPEHTWRHWSGLLCDVVALAKGRSGEAEVRDLNRREQDLRVSR